MACVSIAAGRRDDRFLSGAKLGADNLDLRPLHPSRLTAVPTVYTLR